MFLSAAAERINAYSRIVAQKHIEHNLPYIFSRPDPKVK
jgi:hypothetical protein